MTCRTGNERRGVAQCKGYTQGERQRERGGQHASSGAMVSNSEEERRRERGFVEGKREGYEMGIERRDGDQEERTENRDEWSQG